MDTNVMQTKLPASTLTYMLTARIIFTVIVFIACFFIIQNNADATLNPLFINGGILVLGCIAIIHSILYYNLFSYGVTSSNITINSGIIFRESKTVDFIKIQNINNVRGPLLMLFGLTELQIWTASPSQMSYTMVSSNGQRNVAPRPKPEATLIITKEQAESIRATLTQHNVAPGVTQTI